MTEKLQLGDRVTIRRSKTVFEVVEVDPANVGMPAIPSTYLVRLKPVSGPGPELVYGNAALDKVG